MYQISREELAKGNASLASAPYNVAPAGEEEYDEDDFWDNDDADDDPGYSNYRDHGAEPAARPDVLCTPKGQLVNVSDL